METRLAKFADDVLRRHRRPRVLDYATPEPQVTWWDRAGGVWGWVLDHPCLSLFTLGIGVCWAGSYCEPVRFARAVVEIGLLMILLAVQWWAVRPPKW